jgi:hypothetical protein
MASNLRRWDFKTTYLYSKYDCQSFFLKSNPFFAKDTYLVDFGA